MVGVGVGASPTSSGPTSRSQLPQPHLYQSYQPSVPGPPPPHAHQSHGHQLHHQPSSAQLLSPHQHHHHPQQAQRYSSSTSGASSSSSSASAGPALPRRGPIVTTHDITSAGGGAGYSSPSSVVTNSQMNMAVGLGVKYSCPQPTSQPRPQPHSAGAPPSKAQHTLPGVHHGRMVGRPPRAAVGMVSGGSSSSSGMGPRYHLPTASATSGNVGWQPMVASMSSRVSTVGAGDGASPYKRARAQSPGAIQGAVVPPVPQQRAPGSYPYPQDASAVARYASMSVPTSYAAYTYQVSPSHPYAVERQPAKINQTEGFRREISEMPTRRRPTLLDNYSTHAASLEREKHAPEQYHFGYPGAAPAAPEQREVVPPASYISARGGGPVPQAAAAPQQPQPHQQHVPPKRPKLAVDARPELTQPLRIETANLDIKREPVYNPQVEAISPTVPGEDSKSELSSVQSSKEELLQSINRVDREIGKVEMQISKLQKKQSEFLAEQAKPPEAKAEVADLICSEPKNQSIAQIVYAENRKKAESAHVLLSKLGNKVDLPLYNQPSDTAVYHENKRSYMTFKKRLLLHFKKKHHSRLIRERYLTERYDQLMQAWLKRLERSENNAKRRAKDVRTREFFEKVFPELKKQREDRERIQSRAEATPAHHSRVGANNRVGGYARSEAELEQIMDGLHEQEEEEKKMRSLAVIPPMLLDEREREIRFSNTNGRIEDPMAESKERLVFNVWTQSEKDMFKERFLQHPKNFGYIASFLERKSVQDCVQYYYLSKKSENYKQLLRKQSVKKRKFPKHPRMRPAVSEEKEEKPEPADTETVPIINTTPKVPFSVLRERKPHDERERGPGPAASSVAPPITTTAAAMPTTTSTTSTVVTTSATSTTAHQVQVTSTVSSSSVASTTTSTSLASSSSTSTDSASTAGADAAQGTTQEEAPVKTEVKTEVKPEPMDEGEAAQKDNVPPSEQGTQQCTICKSDLEPYASSRPLTKSNCENYGIKEADLKQDMRVCSSCRCRVVRKHRYTHCPVPMCKTPKRKVKRLRPLPAKWSELPSDLKDPIIKELQLSDEITRCCSACFNRIARRLGNNPQTNEPLVPLVPENNDEVVETPRWTEEEMEIAKQGLREHGRDWAAISASVATKSEAQCKNFYFNYKRKFGLEQLVEESKRNKAKDGDGRTISTSESVTSTITAPSEEDLTSSDEDNGEDNDETSDTASAASPPPVHRSEQRHDSSTVDAMEVDTEKKDVVDKPGADEKVTAESLANSNPNLSASQGSLRSIPDYDSSATLSADEGPPSGHGHENERKTDSVPAAPTVNTATSEQYVSSSARPYSGGIVSAAPSGPPPPQQKVPVSQVPERQNLPGPSGQPDGPGLTNHRRAVEMAQVREPLKPAPGLLDRRSSPACVRDLIDCAIERNIVQDLRTQKEQAMSEFQAHQLSQYMMTKNRDGAALPHGVHPSQLQGAPRLPYPKEMARKEAELRGTPEQATSAVTSSTRPIVVDGPVRHTESPYQRPPYVPSPQTQARPDDREAEAAQDLSRRPLAQPVRDRSPHTAYKGNPRDYDPHDPRYHELYRHHTQSAESHPMQPLRAPPPAHSHHGMKRPGVQTQEGLHQLASAASEREPHRPHSEPREKSPSTYMPDRSQMTPPALRQSVSPYPMDRASQQHARQQQQMRGNTHGGPPPLIKQAVGKPPMKSEKMSPIGQPPPGKPGGSITQGTPVQQSASSQPPTSRYEGSISMGTPRYDTALRGAPVAPGGSISMGTPRYEQGAARSTPPMHPEGAMAPRLPGMYDRTTYDTMRMIQHQDPREIYRRLSPTGQPAAAYYHGGMTYPGPQQAAAQQYQQSELSSSRAVLVGDFLTAQQMMQAQEAQRRADKERQLSPRTREPIAREPTPGKPYSMEPGMPPPYGHAMYMHPGQVPGSQPERLAGGRTASPMSQDSHGSRADSGHPSSWPPGHPGVPRGAAPSQASPGGQPPPDDRRHPTPPPTRQNVIRSITAGTAGSMIMERMPSPRPNPQVNAHLNGRSPFDTLVNVAASAPSLAVPAKDRHQLSPGIREHPKDRAHAIALEQERHEREQHERREQEARERREAAEAQYREAERERAHRDALAREAHAREQAREAHHRDMQREQERQAERLRELDRREQEQIMLASRYKEMEVRQAAAHAERERQERHEREREKMERERLEMMNDPRNAHRDARPASREGYHHVRPGSGGTLQQLDRPPEARAPYRNHMDSGHHGHPSGYPYHMPPHSAASTHHSQPQSHPQRPESGGMAQRPPSRDSKALEAQERRTEYMSKEGAMKSAVQSGGGQGSSGSSAGSAGPSETFTAANLIDAIIIRTINNGSNNEDEKHVERGPSVPHSSAPPNSDPSKYMHSTAGASVSSSSRGPPHPHPAVSISQSHHHPSTSQSHPHVSHPTTASQQIHQHHTHPHHPSASHPSHPKDPTKDQRSPPYKPHKHGYEPHQDHPDHHPQHQPHPQQQQPQQQQHRQHHMPHPGHHGHPGQAALQRDSSSAPHQGVSSSADVERSQGGSPAGSDKSAKSNQSAHSSASARAMTLGEHIDAIIIEDYTRKGGQGSSPKNGQQSVPESNIHPTIREVASKTEDPSAADIQSFLAGPGQQPPHPHLSQPKLDGSVVMAAQSPPMRPMSSPSSHAGHQVAPDSSGSSGYGGQGLPPPPQPRGSADSAQQSANNRPRSMSVGNHHKGPLPYRPPPMLGPDHMMREAQRAAERERNEAVSQQQQHHHPHQPPPPQPPPPQMHNGPHRHPASPQPPPSQAPPSSHGQVHRPTPPPPPPPQQGQHPEQGSSAADNRPRSFSAGAHKITPAWNNWKLKRAYQQQERDQQQPPPHGGAQVMSASGHPQPAPSPMVLATDEREIVKVARLETNDPRVSQSGQPEQRSPQVGYIDPISPASSSTDSGGPESGMKTSPPRSPRIHQGGPGSHGMLGHAALQPGHPVSSSQSQKGLPVGSTHQPISSLAASHQAITSILSRPQNKQNKTKHSSFPADSSVMGQRGGAPSPTGGHPRGGPPPQSTLHPGSMKPLTYVQDKIAEVMQNMEPVSRPSSSTGASPVETSGGSWDKRHMLHPLDAGRYPGGPVPGARGSVAAESSTGHRGEWAGDRGYLGGRSPLRDDTVTASRQRSPRPSIHSQSSEESQGSAVSSADDVYNATSSTGSMKPPASTSSGPPPGARDYRDRLVSSPMMADGSGYPRSPRPSYTGRVSSMAESSSNSRSPQFSSIGTSDMVSGSGEDMMRPNQSGAASEAHSSDHRTSHAPQPGAPHVRPMDMGPDRGDNPGMGGSPGSDRMVIDEVGGADSSAQALERISPNSNNNDGSQTAGSSSSSSAISTSQHQQGAVSTPASSSSKTQPDYMDVDSQSGKLTRGGVGGGNTSSEPGCRAPTSVAQSPHHHHQSIESSSTSVSSAISSSGPPHVDSSRGNYPSPHYPPPGDRGPPGGPPPPGIHTSTEAGSGVSTSSAAATSTYGGRYLYPVMPNQHAGAPLGQRASPATSPAPINREAEPSPILSSQYEPLSDDE